MQINMSERGDIVIKPETSIERYALKAWAEGKKTGKIAGCFVIDVTPPPIAPTPAPDNRYVTEF